MEGRKEGTIGMQEKEGRKELLEGRKGGRKEGRTDRRKEGRKEGNSLGKEEGVKFKESGAKNAPPRAETRRLTWRPHIRPEFVSRVPSIMWASVGRGVGKKNSRLKAFLILLEVVAPFWPLVRKTAVSLSLAGIFCPESPNFGKTLRVGGAWERD